MGDWPRLTETEITPSNPDGAFHHLQHVDDDGRDCSVPLRREGQQQLIDRKTPCGRIARHSIKKDPCDQKVGHLALEKQVLQSFVVSTAKAPWINMSHMKAIGQASTSIEHPVCNFPIEIDYWPV